MPPRSALRVLSAPQGGACWLEAALRWGNLPPRSALRVLTAPQGGACLLEAARRWRTA